MSERSLVATSTRAEVGELARLAWPIAVAQLGMVAMGLVDTAILGRSSVVDLAGAALGRSLAYVPLGLSIGVTAALDPLASQAIGAREPSRAHEAYRSTLATVLLLWLPQTLASLAATFALVPLGVEADVAERARAFVIGGAGGNLGFAVFLACKSFAQAHGRTRPALVAAALGNVVNFVVCSLLVRGDDALEAVGLRPLGLPRLGALGAGASSTIATACMAAIGWAAARRLAPKTRDGARVPIRRVLALGVPIGLQVIVEMGVFSLVSMLAGTLGSRVTSAHQIALGLASFTFMGALGVSGATAVRVGYAVGAGASPRRAGVVGMTMGTLVMSLGALAFVFFPEPLVACFTNDPEVARLGARLVRVAAAFQLFDGLQVSAGGALRGVGEVRFPFVATTLAHWLVGFPLALAFGFAAGAGAVGMWWGLTAGLVTVSLVLAARFLFVTRGDSAVRRA